MKTKEVPIGYKQTELGIIPHDWEIKTFDELGNIEIGLTYSPENTAPYGLLVLRSSNIQNNKISLLDNVYVNIRAKHNQYVRKDDLLICVRNGSANLIGKCALIDKELNATFGAFMSIFRSSVNNLIFQLFNSQILIKQIKNNSNATINQITNKDLKIIKYLSQRILQNKKQ